MQHEKSFDPETEGDTHTISRRKKILLPRTEDVSNVQYTRSNEHPDASNNISSITKNKTATILRKRSPPTSSPGPSNSMQIDNPNEIKTVPTKKAKYKVLPVVQATPSAYMQSYVNSSMPKVNMRIDKVAKTVNMHTDKVAKTVKTPLAPRNKLDAQHKTFYRNNKQRRLSEHAAISNKSSPLVRKSPSPTVSSALLKAKTIDIVKVIPVKNHSEKLPHMPHSRHTTYPTYRTYKTWPINMSQVTQIIRQRT